MLYIKPFPVVSPVMIFSVKPNKVSVCQKVRDMFDCYIIGFLKKINFVQLNIRMFSVILP